MHVAYICADRGVPIFGQKGCSIHVQEILRAMLQRGWTVDLFASRIGGEPPHDLRSLSVHELPEFLPQVSIPTSTSDFVFGANRLLHTLLEECDSYDLIYERYSLWSFAGMEYASESQTPSVLEVNAPLIREQARYRSLEDPDLAEDVATRAFGAAKSMVAVSEEVADYLRLRPEVADRVHVVPNGVNAERFGRIDRTSRLHDDAIKIGFVGSLKPWHGIDTLVESFGRLSESYPDVRLLIVGDGPERAALQAKVRELLPSRTGTVDLVGAVDHDCVPELLVNMDIAVAPYPPLEEFYFSPLKIYEYMAAGCAVIASRIGACRQIIDHGENGLLCTPGDADDLVDKLRLLYRNPDLRRKLGDAARTTMMQQHTWNHVLTSIIATTELPTAETCEGASP